MLPLLPRKGNHHEQKYRDAPTLTAYTVPGVPAKQGMEAGLQAMAAGGSLMVGTLQGGSREATRFEPDRDAAGAMTDPAAFDAFLGRVRAGGAPLPWLPDNRVFFAFEGGYNEGRNFSLS